MARAWSCSQRATAATNPSTSGPGSGNASRALRQVMISNGLNWVDPGEGVKLVIRVRGSIRFIGFTRNPITP